jgi:hypothetical protein
MKNTRKPGEISLFQLSMSIGKHKPTKVNNHVNDNSVSPVSGFIPVLDWAEYHLVVIITPEEYGSCVAIVAAFPITDASNKNVLPGKQPICVGIQYHCGKLTDSIPTFGDRQSTYGH